MFTGRYVFSQLMSLVSPTSFQTIVNRHSGDFKVREFSSWKQFLCMAFGQLTHRENITDTMMCINGIANKSYHLGFGKVVAVSTITRANENRSYKIYEEHAMLLIKEAKLLYIDDNKLEIELRENVFAHRRNYH